jgi:hypothetical protein
MIGILGGIVLTVVYIYDEYRPDPPEMPDPDADSGRR